MVSMGDTFYFGLCERLKRKNILFRWIYSMKEVVFLNIEYIQRIFNCSEFIYDCVLLQGQVHFVLEEQDYFLF